MIDIIKFPLFPEITLFCSALIILMADVFLAKKFKNFFKFSYAFAIVATLFSLVLITATSRVPENFFYSMLYTNGFTIFVKACLAILLIFVIILSYEYIKKKYESSAEFLALIMIATVGTMLLIQANDFLIFYLSLELQSLPLYLLAAMNKSSTRSSESGVKYFVLGSAASGILLLGISLFYGFSGTTHFDAAFNLYSNNQIPPAVVLGFVLILTAIFFKISAAPFHMWTPDVYQGSHAVVTTFFATISKFSATLILVRIFLDLSTGFDGMNNVLIFVAVLSMAVGSFGAIRQENMKRLLAYSSIGHVGFVLFGLSALSLEGIKACVIYMVIYSVISIGNFGFLTLISRSGDNGNESDANDDKRYAISSLAGIARKSPILALSFAVLMFSTAGIPPLAGFFSKFYVIVTTVKEGYYIASVLAVLFSTVSAYYYLRIVKVMYFDKSDVSTQVRFFKRLASKVVIVFVALLNLTFIFYLKAFSSLVSRILGF